MANTRIQYSFNVDLADFRRKVEEAKRIVLGLQNTGVDIPIVPKVSGPENKTTGSQFVVTPPSHVTPPPAGPSYIPIPVHVPGGAVPRNFVVSTGGAPRPTGSSASTGSQPPGAKFIITRPGGSPASYVVPPISGSGQMPYEIGKGAALMPPPWMPSGPLPVGGRPQDYAVKWPEGTTPPHLSFMPREISRHSTPLGSGGAFSVSKKFDPDIGAGRIPDNVTDYSARDIIRRVADNTKKTAEETSVVARMSKDMIRPDPRFSPIVGNTIKRLVGEPIRGAGLSSSIDTGTYISTRLFGRYGKSALEAESVAAYSPRLASSPYSVGWGTPVNKPIGMPVPMTAPHGGTYAMEMARRIYGADRLNRSFFATPEPPKPALQPASEMSRMAPGHTIPARVRGYGNIPMAMENVARTRLWRDIVDKNYAVTDGGAAAGRRLSAGGQARQARAISNYENLMAGGSGLSRAGAWLGGAMTKQRRLPNVMNLQTIAGVYFGTKLTQSISEAGTKMEYLRRMYEVFYGDAKRGAQELEKTLETARITPFDAMEIADQRRLLRAFGIDSQRILMGIANTAAATDKPLQQITIALGRLAAGVYGEGFEGLRRIGISHRELTAEGLKFNPRSMQYMGNPEEAINAVLRIMERRFPDMAQGMVDTWKGATVNLRDAWHQAIAPLGEAMHTALIGPVQDLTQYMIQLRDGFVMNDTKLADYAKTLNETINKLFDTGSPRGLSEAVGDDPQAALAKLQLTQSMNESGQPVMGNAFGKFLFQTGSFLGANILGGLSGLGTLFTHWDLGKAAKAVEDRKEQFYGIEAGMMSNEDIFEAEKKINAKRRDRDFGDASNKVSWDYGAKVGYSAYEQRILDEANERRAVAANYQRNTDVLGNMVVDASNKEAEQRSASKEASRATLIANDRKALMAMDAEIQRRRHHMFNMADIERQKAGRAAREMGYGEDYAAIAAIKARKEFIAAEEARMKPLTDRRQVVAQRLKSPTAYDIRLRQMSAEKKRKDIADQDAQSQKFSNVTVNNTNVNNTHIYGNRSAVQTGIAGQMAGIP